RCGQRHSGAVRDTRRQVARGRRRTGGACSAVLEHRVEAGDGAEQAEQLADAGREPEGPETGTHRPALVGPPGRGSCVPRRPGGGGGRGGGRARGRAPWRRPPYARPAATSSVVTTDWKSTQRRNRPWRIVLAFVSGGSGASFGTRASTGAATAAEEMPELPSW